VSRLSAVLASLLLLSAGTAQAERYRVDLIVFADKTGVADEAPLSLQVPNVKGSLEPYDATALKAAGIEMLPDDQFGLAEPWAHLRNSKNHQPLLRLSWLQKDPPADRSVSLHIHSGNALASTTDSGATAIYPVDGTIALLAGHFLHVDADLVWTQGSGGGNLVSYRLREKRRVKRDELHHLDSPKLGLLVEVTRVDVPPKPAKKGKKK
jgi:hypothetical protein